MPKWLRGIELLTGNKILNIHSRGAGERERKHSPVESSETRHAVTQPESQNLGGGGRMIRNARSFLTHRTLYNTKNKNEQQIKHQVRYLLCPTSGLGLIQIILLTPKAAVSEFFC